MRKRMSNEQCAYFIQNYVELGPDKLTQNFNELFGTNKGGAWAKNTAKRLGVSMRDSPPGWYSVSEVSYLFQTTSANIQLKIKNKTIKARLFGKRKYFIHEDEIPKIESWYTSVQKRPPWPAVSTAEAGDMLGMSSTAISQVVKRGHIDAVKRGKDYWVRKEHIEWGLKQMKDHGFTKIPWYKMRERIKV